MTTPPPIAAVPLERPVPRAAPADAAVEPALIDLGVPDPSPPIPPARRRPRRPVVLGAVMLCLIGYAGWRAVAVDRPTAPVLRAGTATTGGYPGRVPEVVVSVPVAAPGFGLDWVTPELPDVIGLDHLRVYLLPATAPAGSDARAAARALSSVGRAEPFLISFRADVDCAVTPPPRQALPLRLAYRAGATVRQVEVRGMPELTSATITGLCAGPRSAGAARLDVPR